MNVLQLAQREALGQQREADRRIIQLAAQPGPSSPIAATRPPVSPGQSTAIRARVRL
jgi:hypothetical protein